MAKIIKLMQKNSKAFCPNDNLMSTLHSKGGFENFTEIKRRGACEKFK